MSLLSHLHGHLIRAFDGVDVMSKLKDVIEVEFVG